jgi:uncharacterized protein YjdB
VAPNPTTAAPARPRSRALYRRLFGEGVARLGAVALLLAAGCTGGDSPLSPAAPGPRLALSVNYTVTDAAALPVTHARLTATQVSSNVVLGRTVTPVNDTGDEFELAFDFELPNGQPTTVLVLLELLNVTNGVESVVWSGLVGPLEARPGIAPAPRSVDLVRGGPHNLAITGISVASPGSLLEGTQVQLAATVTGTAAPTIVWTSLDPSIATVDVDGRLSTLRPGRARVQAVAGLHRATVEVEVRQRLARVGLSPDTPRLNALGSEITLTASGLDPRGGVVPGQTFEWAVTAGDAVEALGGGRFRARAAGSSTVTATTMFEGQLVTGSVDIVVQQQVASVIAEPSPLVIGALGGAAPIVAVARDANGNLVAGTTFIWTSANPAVATVDGNGVVTARAIGATSVRAAAGGHHVDVPVTVRQEIARIAVSPASAAFDALLQEIVFNATAFDAADNPVPNVTFSWSSEQAAVVAIDASTGAATSIQPGRTSVVASSGGVRGTSAVVVQQQPAAVVIEPAEAVIVGTGVTLRFSAATLDRNGHAIADARAAWSSADPAVAVINPVTGVATAVGPGVTRISASVGGVDGSATLEVTGSTSTVHLVEVSPASVFLPTIGATRLLTARAFAADGAELPGLPVTWSTSDPAIATVNGEGAVRSVGAGNALITALIGGVAGTADIRVGAETPPTAGRDVVVFNDVNIFDNTAMASPSNVAMVRNLVLFDAGGARAGADRVWIDYGRNSRCTSCITTTTLMSTINATGMTAQIVHSSSGSLVDIPADVKVIFLWLPAVAYTTDEINALKAFAGAGGRLVFVGEHSGFYGSWIPLQNQFLEQMGAVMRNVGDAVDCGRVTLPAGSLRPHQVTQGMTEVLVGCASVIQLGPEDFALFYDLSNSRVLAGVAKIDTRPIGVNAQRVGELEPARQSIAPALAGSMDPLYNPRTTTGR